MDKNNNHIPTEVIIKDIHDTVIEISQMTAEMDNLESTPLSSPDAKINHIKASARRSGIENREQFLISLRKILCGREEHHFAPANELQLRCIYCGKIHPK